MYFQGSPLCCFSITVIPNSLWPHELQCTVIPCPSLSPGICSDSWPSSMRCYRAISSPVAPFSFSLQPFHLVKGPSSQSYSFSSSHVWMGELGYKESWAPKNKCFWTVMLEKTLESPLDCKEIQLVNLKGNQSWIFIERTDAEAETPILWPPDAKNWLFGKDPEAGKHWRWEKGMIEDEMVGWHHWLDGHEFE